MHHFSALANVFIDYLSTSHLYYINCYFCESSLVFTFRFYSQSFRRIIFSRSQTSFHQLFINVLCVIIFIVIKLSRLFRSIYILIFEGNSLENIDLYYYRNLSVIWIDLIKSYNNRMHLEAFFSIETLHSHIFFDFRLSEFWYASDKCRILFPKYRFLIKSEIFV